MGGRFTCPAGYVVQLRVEKMPRNFQDLKLFLSERVEGWPMSRIEIL